MANQTNTDFLNGVPEMLVLRLLSRKPMHGYEIVQEIRVATNGDLEFGEGCIYPLLHKLKRQKLLSSRRDVVAGRSRVVYRLTAKGQTKLSASTIRWQNISAAIRSALGIDSSKGVEHVA